MLNFIKGKIDEKGEQFVTVECSGLGYECFVSNQTLSQLVVGQEVKLLTHFVVREDSMQLFGFLEKIEKNLFLKLITISGVGAKVALSVLSGLSTNRLINAIANGDVATICSTKGIGKKTAERIALELKDKIIDEFLIKGNPDFAQPNEEGAISTNIHISALPIESSSKALQAIEALIALGYTKAEATKAVTNIKDLNSFSVEELIVKALRG